MLHSCRGHPQQRNDQVYDERSTEWHGWLWYPDAVPSSPLTIKGDKCGRMNLIGSRQNLSVQSSCLARSEHLLNPLCRNLPGELVANAASRRACSHVHISPTATATDGSALVLAGCNDAHHLSSSRQRARRCRGRAPVDLLPSLRLASSR